MKALEYLMPIKDSIPKNHAYDSKTEEDSQQDWDDYFSFLDYLTEECINDYEHWDDFFSVLGFVPEE